MQEVWRTNLTLLAVAVVAGALFFSHLGELWPLAPVDLVADRGALEAEARRELAERGLDVAGYQAASRLVVDDAALDYLQRAFGFDRTQKLIAGGLPVFVYEVDFKRRGEPDSLWAMVRPAETDRGTAGGVGGVDRPGRPDGKDRVRLAGWGRSLQEDAPGARLDREAARKLAEPVVARMGRSGPSWREQGSADQVLPARTDHRFLFERLLSERPELRERLTVTVAGDRVVAVDLALVVPEAARRTERARQAPVVALQTVGFGALGVALIGAFAVFLLRLRDGTARLGQPALWAALIGLCFLLTRALEGAALLLAWDPLWPRWVADLQQLGLAAAGGALITLVLLVVISAGDALDRRVTARASAQPGDGRPASDAPDHLSEPPPSRRGPLPGRRGASLWLAGRGRLAAPAVGLASLRGFLVGVTCGGVLTAALLALEAFTGARVPIQPQGFFFYALNSDAPALSTLLYFLMVALAEELGYRFFAGSWVLAALDGRRLAGAAAVVVPALIYGTTHTGLTFLPPEDPFWGRALVFTLVGCVWGWAFLRFDALTVVLSHWTADLFIFNWPRLASGRPELVVTAVATIAVPLVPAALWLGSSLVGRGRRSRRVGRSRPPSG